MPRAGLGVEEGQDMLQTWQSSYLYQQLSL